MDCLDCKYRHTIDNRCATCSDNSLHEPDAFIRRWTNFELMKWLSDNNGRISVNGKIQTHWDYSDDDCNTVPDGVLVQGWNENFWTQPQSLIKVSMREMLSRLFHRIKFS